MGGLYLCLQGRKGKEQCRAGLCVVAALRGLGHATCDIGRGSAANVHDVIASCLCDWPFQALPLICTAWPTRPFSSTLVSVQWRMKTPKIFVECVHDTVGSSPVTLKSFLDMSDSLTCRALPSSPA